MLDDSCLSNKKSLQLREISFEAITCSSSDVVDKAAEKHPSKPIKSPYLNKLAEKCNDVTHPPILIVSIYVTNHVNIRDCAI